VPKSKLLGLVRVGYITGQKLILSACQLYQTIESVLPDIVDSAPSLGVYYFLSLTLSVCMSICCSVCHGKLQIDSSFSLLDGIESFFGHQFSMWHSTKRCFSIFDLGPLTPKIYSPKFACGSLSQL